MSDLISRREAIEALDQHSYENGSDYDKTVELLNELPGVDAVPVVHARWIFRKDPKYSYCTQAVCSACKAVAASNGDLFVDTMQRCFSENHKFCPNCGARMDGDAE